MRLLGAIIAGGQATRFGSDKALALWRDRPLIDHVAVALRRHTDEVVVCGRAWGGLRHLADLPQPGLGPLGGVCAALSLARDDGFDAVFTAPCDTPHVAPLPLDGAPVFAADCPVIGLWPAALADGLRDHLARGGRRSMRAWAEQVGAAAVLPDHTIPNVNSTADLDRLGG